MNTNHVSLIAGVESTHTCRQKSPAREIAREMDRTTYTGTRGETIILHEHHCGDSCEVYTEIVNSTEKPLRYSQISSAFVEVENPGSLSWGARQKYRVHFCRGCWLGEGQWQTRTLAELGLYDTGCGHQNRSFAAISSVGSWTTAPYYPMLLLEDLECGITHYFEILPHGSWYIEIAEGYNDAGRETLFVFLSGGVEKNDAFRISLAPGEHYKTVSAVYGTVNGGFEAAVAALTRYKRAKSLANYPDNIPPVCYNDYMNCVWAMPSAEKEFPLIDAAAEAGAEVFTMDAGWYTAEDNALNQPGNWGIGLGDWVVNDELFAPHTLAEIIRYTNEKGMRFGIWLEIECVTKFSAGYTKYADCLLTRAGDVINEGRAFYDFRRPEIREKITAVFDRLYAMGVRYVKNDYNNTIGLGCDDSSCLSEGLRASQEAFLSLIDEIRAKYPDLWIESCASGAMRSDAGTLSHFQLQSVSDQEVYTNMPSIITGSLACIQPEKLGIWAYPYPIRYDDRMKYEIPEEQRRACADGRETVFNMVNAMLGTPYISGRIDAADDLNRRLIHDAVRVYKSIRADIPKSTPIFPTGMFHLGDTGVFCTGNLVPEKKCAYLAVWKIGTEESGVIDLSRYGAVKNVELLYPTAAGYAAREDGGALRVTLPKGDAALFVRVDFA